MQGRKAINELSETPRSCGAGFATARAAWGGEGCQICVGGARSASDGTPTACRHSYTACPGRVWVRTAAPNSWPRSLPLAPSDTICGFRYVCRPRPGGPGAAAQVRGEAPAGGRANVCVRLQKRACRSAE